MHDDVGNEQRQGTLPTLPDENVLSVDIACIFLYTIRFFGNLRIWILYHNIGGEEW